jgi:hypothetical protein
MDQKPDPDQSQERSSELANAANPPQQGGASTPSQQPQQGGTPSPQHGGNQSPQGPRVIRDWASI